jgi:sugar O-acyltransferase (sialic acid O-acetyltransferase NeuD family)
LQVNPRKKFFDALIFICNAPMMAARLVIIGTGGSAFDVLDIVDALNKATLRQEITGFLDDARTAGTHHLGLPVLGALRDSAKFADCSFINVIGSDVSFRKRLDIIQSTGLPSERFAALIHPQASVSPWAKLGSGVYVSFGCSISGAVVVGDHVSFSPGCIVGHDSKIGDGALIAPGAIISGFVEVGRCAYIGAGAMIKQRVKIGDGALVGMGAVVTKDVAPGAVVVGNPAGQLRRS